MRVPYEELKFSFEKLQNLCYETYTKHFTSSINTPHSLSFKTSQQGALQSLSQDVLVVVLGVRVNLGSPALVFKEVWYGFSVHFFLCKT
jgi:hypothetical protein